MPSAGGTLTPLTKLEPGEVTHRWPQGLPGGKAALFTAHTSTGGFDGAHIDVVSFADGQRKLLLRNGTFGQYLDSGHIIYVQRGHAVCRAVRLEPAPGDWRGVAGLGGCGSWRCDPVRGGAAQCLANRHARVPRWRGQVDRAVAGHRGPNQTPLGDTFDNRIMVATYTAKGDVLIKDKPRVWSDSQIADISVILNDDVTTDGTRVVALMPADEPSELNKRPLDLPAEFP